LLPRCSVNIKDVIREVLVAREKGTPIVASVSSRSEKRTESFSNRGSVSPQRSLMSEIESAVRGGKLVLRKVDTAAEMENRKKDREKSQFQQLMEEVRARAVANERRLVLLDQGTLPPKEFWKVSLGRWYEEVEKGFVADQTIMKLVFTLLERTEDEITFEEARKIVAPSTSMESLAALMNAMGFTLKRNLILEDEKKQKGENRIRSNPQAKQFPCQVHVESNFACCR